MATLIPNYDLAEKIGDRIEIDASTVGDLIEEGPQTRFIDTKVLQVRQHPRHRVSLWA